MIPRVVAATKKDAAFLGAAWVAERAHRAVRERGVFTIALTGGESPGELYAALRARDDIDWPRWEVFLGDERAVPESDPRSNLRNAREALLAHVAVDPARVHPMYAAGLSLDAMALAYERALGDVLGDERAFDLVLLGLGKDGHTLSLHPRCPAIAERARDVVAIESPPMDPPVSRISFTPPMVERARSVMLLAYGPSKAAPVRAVCEGADDRMAVPGQIVRDARGEVLGLFDDAAASMLDPRASHDG